MIENGLQDFFTSKELGGYFSKVVTINGFGKISEKSTHNGKPICIEHNDTHTYIEATNSKYNLLHKTPILNFLISQVRLYFVISKVLKKYQFDFVRAEDPRYNGLLALYFSRKMKKPLVVGSWGNPDTIRELTGKPTTPRLFRTVFFEKRIERFVFRRCNLGIAQNNDNLNFIRQFGIPEERLGIFRLGNAINALHFLEPSQRDLIDLFQMYSPKVNAKIIVCVSALEKRKIIEDALLAFSEINRHLESHLFLIGVGSSEKFYRQEVQRLNLNNSVTFTGLIDQLLLSQILAQSDLILSPLTGRALTEGMLSGTPVIAYNIDCHPDYIQHGVNGFLVEYRNVEKMAAEAVTLLKNQILAKKIGLAGRASTLEVMNPEKLIIAQREYFEKISY